MRFEYNLKYDFVDSKLSFQITKMEESLRGKCDIKELIIDGEDWHIKSISYPAIYAGDERMSNLIYLAGSSRESDSREIYFYCDAELALTIAKVLKEFQSWVENEYEEPKTEMTIAEIEKALGKKIKVVKEKK